VNQFMIYDPEKITLGYIGFIQKEKIEKGERSTVLIDEDKINLSVLLVSILFDQQKQPCDFVGESSKEKSHPR
jgi:hypothetical protein